MGCIFLMIILFSIVTIAMLRAVLSPYKFRLTIIMIFITIFIMLWLPIMCLRPRDYRNALPAAWIFRKMCHSIGITTEVRGHENLRRNKGAIVLMNHQSLLDLMLLAEIWPIIGRATVVSRREVIYVPFFGIGAWLWGTLFINRSKREDAIASLMKQSRAINEQNCKILIFPEGKRNFDNGFLPFKKGPFHMAINSQCPIQPVIATKYNFTDAKRKSFQPGHIIIKIIPEIDSRDFQDINELNAYCRKIMINEYDRLNAEFKISTNSGSS